MAQARGPLVSGPLMLAAASRGPHPPLQPLPPPASREQPPTAAPSPPAAAPRSPYVGADLKLVRVDLGLGGPRPALHDPLHREAACVRAGEGVTRRRERSAARAAPRTCRGPCGPRGARRGPMTRVPKHCDRPCVHTRLVEAIPSPDQVPSHAPTPLTVCEPDISASSSALSAPGASVTSTAASGKGRASEAATRCDHNRRALLLTHRCRLRLVLDLLDHGVHLIHLDVLSGHGPASIQARETRSARCSPMLVRLPCTLYPVNQQ